MKDDAVHQLSALLNTAQQRVVPAWETPSWFKLFRHVDSDGSGLISYDEFVEMVRNDLKLSARVLPEARIQVVWLALDTDGSGYLSSGEFGAFMRLGAQRVDDASTPRSPRHRSPPRAPTLAVAHSPRAGPSFPGEFLTRTSRDAKQHRALLDAAERQRCDLARRRYLQRDAATEGLVSPRSRHLSARNHRETPWKAQSTEAARSSTLARLLGEAPHAELAAQSTEADRSKMLAALLAEASHAELAEAILALPPARRQLLFQLAAPESEGAHATATPSEAPAP